MPDGSVRDAASKPGLGCATCPGCAAVCRRARGLRRALRLGGIRRPERRRRQRVHENVAEQQSAAPSEPMVFTLARTAPGALRGVRRCRRTIASNAGAARIDAVVRARLVEAARYRPSVLRLVGADLLAHPQAALLIYDAVRLFPHVEVAGEASAVVEWSDLDLRRLKDLRRIDVALYGPDAATHDAHCGIPGAFAAMLRGVERLRADGQDPGRRLRDPARRALGPGLRRGLGPRRRLPGEPRFRLSARRLVAGRAGRVRARAAARAGAIGVAGRVAALLVRAEGLATSRRAPEIERRVAAQQTIHCGRSVPYRPCGSDPIGAFEACREGAECVCTSRAVPERRSDGRAQRGQSDGR